MNHHLESLDFLAEAILTVSLDKEFQDLDSEQRRNGVPGQDDLNVEVNMQVVFTCTQSLVLLVEPRFGVAWASNC